MVTIHDTKVDLQLRPSIGLPGLCLLVLGALSAPAEGGGWISASLDSKMLGLLVASVLWPLKVLKGSHSSRHSTLKRRKSKVSDVIRITHATPDVTLSQPSRIRFPSCKI